MHKGRCVLVVKGTNMATYRGSRGRFFIIVRNKQHVVAALRDAQKII